MSQLLNRVVFVKDPTALPEGMKHHTAVEALSRNNRVVILLSHGNKYNFPKGWLLPENVSLIEYEFDNKSIEAGTSQVRAMLRRHGIDLYSRHLDNSDPMPMLLAGSLMTLSPGTQVTFVNKPDQYTTAETPKREPVTVDCDWDLLT